MTGWVVAMMLLSVLWLLFEEHRMVNEGARMAIDYRMLSRWTMAFWFIAVLNFGVQLYITLVPSTSIEVKFK